MIVDVTKSKLENVNIQCFAMTVLFHHYVLVDYCTISVYLQIYELLVLETKPGNAVSIIECDMQVMNIIVVVSNTNKVSFIRLSLAVVIEIL